MTADPENNGDILKVEGLKGNRDRQGTVAKVYAVKLVDANSSTVVVTGKHAELADRDQVTFVHPTGGLERLVVTGAEILGEDTRILLAPLRITSRVSSSACLVEKCLRTPPATSSPMLDGVQISAST